MSGLLRGNGWAVIAGLDPAIQDNGLESLRLDGRIKSGHDTEKA